MQTKDTVLKTRTVFSDDGVKRYLLRKEWDSKKPKLCIIMLAPSKAAGIELDSSTLLVLNNASRLGYGRVDILNLFATLNDFALKEAEDKDSDNIKAIVTSAKEADTIVYAAGVGKAKNKAFIKRQEQALGALQPYEDKLYCLCNPDKDVRLQHPLSPAVREWELMSIKLTDILPQPEPKHAEAVSISDDKT